MSWETWLFLFVLKLCLISLKNLLLQFFPFSHINVGLWLFGINCVCSASVWRKRDGDIITFSLKPMTLIRPYAKG